MRTASAGTLAGTTFTGYRLRGALGPLVGVLGETAQVFLYSDRWGTGKSTFMLTLADAVSRALAKDDRGVLYVDGEERMSMTTRDRVRQLGLEESGVTFADFASLSDHDSTAALRSYIRRENVGAVVLDSITALDPRGKEGRKFQRWCRDEGVMLLMIAQSTKGGQHRGSNEVPHDVDLVLRLSRDAEASTSTVHVEKSRTGSHPMASVEVPWTGEDVKRLLGERKNPVRLPFGVSFNALAKRFSIRGAARLNELAGFESPAVISMLEGADRLSPAEARTALGRAGVARWSFDLDTTTRPIENGEKARVKVLTVTEFTEADAPDLFEDEGYTSAFANTTVAETAPWDRASTTYEFPGDTFSECFQRFLARFGDRTILIEDQDHAKTVLGSREYKKQEREHAKETAAPKKKSASKKSRKASAPKAKKPAASAPGKPVETTCPYAKGRVTLGRARKKCPKCGADLSQSTHTLYDADGNEVASPKPAPKRKPTKKRTTKKRSGSGRSSTKTPDRPASGGTKKPETPKEPSAADVLAALNGLASAVEAGVIED